jgi:metal-sulfur cluster biosynthetic enzyme
MPSEMQNLNPTILNAADLPTRQGTKSRGGLDESYDGSIFGYVVSETNLSDPFPVDTYSSTESESDDGDLLEEPIDEQEIFGTFGPSILPFLISLPENNIPGGNHTASHTKSRSDLVSSISDPEHPISLGSLAVVSLPDISITPSLPNNLQSPLRTVTVLITPTITHCSLATVIGLGVRVRLEQSLPPRFRIDVRIKEGTHSTAEEVNKQLADKERVAAALENGTLMGVIGRMLETCQ